MDEKHLTLPFGAPQDGYTLLASTKAEKDPTTVGQRFGGFAICHLTYSILLAVSFPVWIELCVSEVTLPLVGLCLMAAYFPLGYLTAYLEEWTVPQNSREKCMAVGYPVVVAWIWVTVVWITLFPESGDFLPVVVVISLFLAAPSSFFVLFFGLAGNSVVDFALVGLVAGFLPPLFFACGSFWQASRREKKNAKQKGTELHEATH